MTYGRKRKRKRGYLQVCQVDTCPRSCRMAALKHAGGIAHPLNTEVIDELAVATAQQALVHGCSRWQAATQRDAEVVAERVAQRGRLGHTPEAADGNVLFVAGLVGVGWRAGGWCMRCKDGGKCEGWART